MQKACLKIDDIKIVRSFIEIDRDCKDKFEIKIECRGRIKKSKKEADHTLLLNVIIDATAVDSNDLSIELESDVLFSYETEFENFDWVIENECMPMAQKEIFNKLDNILVELGYSKLDFAKSV